MCCFFLGYLTIYYHISLLLPFSCCVCSLAKAFVGFYCGVCLLFSFFAALGRLGSGLLLLYNVLKYKRDVFIQFLQSLPFVAVQCYW